MKHKILTRILIIFIGLLVLIGISTFVFVKVRSNIVSNINDRKEKIMSQNSFLVEQRLAYMEIAKLELGDEDAFELIQSSLNTISGFDANNIEDDDLKWGIESVNNVLISKFEIYKKIIEYDIMQDFYSSLASENYEVLLGKVNALAEGMSTYDDQEVIKVEVSAVEENASLLSEALYEENYDGLIIMVENLYRDYEELRKAAIREVKAPLVSDEGVQMLTDLTNLIISNQNELNGYE